MKTLKLEDLSVGLQSRITEQAEHQAALNIIIDGEDELTLVDRIKEAVKKDPYMNANNVCQTVEYYDGHSVGSLLKEIELLKLGHIAQSLWAISLVMKNPTAS